MDSFGERLRALRAEKNLHQSELGQLLDLSPSAIGSYERNLREPSYAHLCQMADLFNVSVDFLLCRTTERLTVKQYLSMDSIELLKLLKDHKITLNGKPLSDDDIERLYSVAIGLFWNRII